MQKIERLVAITLLLQTRGKMSARRLAGILGVSTRTIYRDMMALSLAHVPVAMDYGPGGGYYLPDHYHFESIIFTREEALSLVLSADMVGNYNLFAGDSDLHRALYKLEATLPEEYREDVRTAREHILIDSTDWENGTGSVHLEQIRSAILHAQQLDIFYPCLTCTDVPGVQWQRVNPYGLVLRGIAHRHVRSGIWYMIAYCHECRHFRSFRLKQIEKLRVREDTFLVDPNFDLQKYWKEARKHLDRYKEPCSLQLRVYPPARYTLSGNSQILCEKSDGSAIVHIQTESTEEAVSYTLALGAYAKVISPPQVREAVAATAQAIASMYQEKPVH